MEVKTKKSLFKNIIGSVVGLGMFILAVNFNLPIIGIFGTFLLVPCAVDVVVYSAKGIKETMAFKKYWKERELSKTNSLEYENEQVLLDNKTVLSKDNNPTKNTSYNTEKTTSTNKENHTYSNNKNIVNNTNTKTIKNQNNNEMTK